MAIYLQQILCCYAKADILLVIIEMECQAHIMYTNTIHATAKSFSCRCYIYQCGILHRFSFQTLSVSTKVVVELQFKETAYNRVKRSWHLYAEAEASDSAEKGLIKEGNCFITSTCTDFK